MSDRIADAWTAHLAQYNLTELDPVARSVGYRIRAANTWTFDLEYQAGLAEYQQKGIQTFDNNEHSKAQALLYLAQVQRYIDEWKRDQEKAEEEEEAPYDDRTVNRDYDPYQYE